MSREYRSGGRVLAVAFLWWIVAARLEAGTAVIPEGGRDLLPSDWCAAASAWGSKELWTCRRESFGEGREGWRVEVLDDEADPNRMQLTTRLDGEVRRGDRLLLMFDARCVAGCSEDGGGRVRVMVEIKEPPGYVKLGQDTMAIRSEWRTIFVPFPANADSRRGKTHASILPGGRKQTLEIANLRLLNYGRDFDMGKLPRVRVEYPGRASGAAWREEALARIERVRTTDVAVEVVDPVGRPVAGARVGIVLKRHAFGFGTAVKARWIMGTDENCARYRDVVDANFSAIVLENDLKPFGWEGGATNVGREYRRDWTLGALAWAKGRGMMTRGHYLCWGPWEEWSEKLRGDPAAIRRRILSHLEGVIAGAGGLVDEWDAVNHPVGWSDPRRTVDQVVGGDLYAEVFRMARGRTGVPLWINEDQVFRPGRQQEEFYECIRDLIRRGVVPDGIGNQAHFHASHLPGPEEMLRVSDRFAALVPSLELTEFDIVTNGDDELQADWLRDVLIMAYSHPAYRAVMLWVFYEGAGWKPECALWREDWSEKPAARAWRALVCERWRTRASGVTSGAGLFVARGHRGLYEVSVEVGGRKVVMPFDTERGAGLLRVVRM